jgi:hypothetical protein
LQEKLTCYGGHEPTYKLKRPSKTTHWTK